MAEVRDFLGKYSHNFSRFEDIYELGKGGESRVIRVEPFIPMDVVAKMPLVDEEAYQAAQLYYGLLMKDGLLKMVANKEYICEVLEEVILYNKPKGQIVGFISLVE